MSYGNTTEDALERENQEGIGRLGDKVRMLREMSSGLNETMKEVHPQRLPPFAPLNLLLLSALNSCLQDNRLLGMMDGQFDGVGSMLGTAGDKIKEMTGGQGQHLCYLAGFICFIFVVLYKMAFK